MADVAAQIEHHVERSLKELQTPVVRANASWLPGLPALTEQVERFERSAASELLQRVDQDHAALADAFNDGHDIGALTAVQLGQSDPHNGRRTVALLQFDTGLTIVYKPRSVALEAAFNRLTAWVAATGADLAPRAPKTLEQPGYGYCEYITHRPCLSTHDVQRFYVRLGALARLLQAVRATDCHPANFVAASDWPVLIDAETMVHPRLGSTPTDALLATEILPSQVTTSRGQRIDYGGFDGVQHHRGGRPVLDNSPQPLAEHRGSFDHGVLRMDTALRGRGEELAAPNGPLKLTPGTCTRVVLRPTEMYARLLAHRVSARSLASANGGWPTVERLLRRFEDASLGADAWDAVRAAEKAALQRADIPYVVADPQSGDLFDGMGDLLVPKAYQLDTRVSPSPAGDAQGQ